MKRVNILLIISFATITGCKQSKDPEPFIDNKLNEVWLEKIINKSDSTYKKPYFRREFVTAEYYISKHDSTLCQVMYDSSKNVRQVIIEKKGIRTFYSQYYPNGQTTGTFELNGRGQFEGNAINFYPDGKTKSKGKYYNGLHSGIWESYDENGKLVSKEEYDSNGQLLRTTSY